MIRGISIMPGAFAFVAAMTLMVCANQPPVVNAGGDQMNVSIAGFNRLRGTVTDDSTSFDLLKFRWTQVAGKPATITLPDFTNTTVYYPDSGAYLFELWASDGVLSAVDTVAVKVRPALPFTILSPEKNGVVEIGKPCLIRWQMDPSKPCVVYLSLDDGQTWTIISASGSVSDSLSWTPTADSELASGTVALIKVEEYQNENNYTQGIFVLADPGDNAVVSPKAGPSDRGNLSRIVSVVAGRPAARKLDQMAVFDARGRQAAGAIRSCGIEINPPSPRRR